MVLTRMLEKTRRDPAHFTRLLAQLFDAMQSGGDFGLETIRRFNGHLFEGIEVIELEPLELEANFGAAVLEALACGTPCAATDAGEAVQQIHREVILNGG